MRYLFIVISLIFVVIAGLGDAAQTAKKDLGTDTPIYRAMEGDTLMQAWYRGDGGNARWNPSLPSIPYLYWSSDFWHTCKFIWIYGYACSIATLGCFYWVGWKKRVGVWIVVVILAQGAEGETFRVGYGNLFRNNPSETIIQILLDINPFQNSHK